MGSSPAVQQQTTSQQHQLPPSSTPAHSSPLASPANITNPNANTIPTSPSSPAPIHAGAGGPIPRRREPKSKQDDDAVIERLRAICTDKDPKLLYRNLIKIGSGASGGVFTAYEVGTDNSVAIKQMNLDQQPKKVRRISSLLSFFIYT